MNSNKEVLIPSNSSFDKKDYKELLNYIEDLEERIKQHREVIEVEQTKLIFIRDNLKKSFIVNDRDILNLASYHCDIYISKDVSSDKAKLICKPKGV